MWTKNQHDNNTVWMDITANDRTFVISLYGNRRGVFAKESQELAESTYRNLTDSLAELTDPEKAPRPEAFCDFGSLLFELALPEVIQFELLKHDGPLVFSTHELSLPWELLCNHKGEFLCLKHSFSRQLPTLSRMSDELMGSGQFATDRQVGEGALIIANPTGDLVAAEEEAEELKAIFEKGDIPCDVLIGPRECTYQNIMASHLRRRPYRIIHFSGHAQYLEQKETSAILLADGKMIMAQEIQRTFKGEPVVFLNACWSAMDEKTATTKQRGYSGAQVVRTLTEAFTFGNRLGRVQAIIGSMWWIADTVARGLAGRFYTEVLAGNTLGESLRRAREQVRAEVGDPALWSTYVLFGDPTLELARSPTTETKSEPAGRDREPTTRKAAAVDAGRAGSTQSGKLSAPKTADSDDGGFTLGPPPDPEKGGFTLGSATDSLNLSDGIPWSDDVRTAFVGALATMAAMNWSAFTTIHLVLGLTYIDNGLLSNAMDRSGLDHDITRRSLRKIFTLDQTTTAIESDSVISDNTKRILKNARETAQAENATEVTEAHLITGLLNNSESGAVVLLKALNIDLDELAERISVGAENREEPSHAPTAEVTTTPNSETQTADADVSAKREKPLDDMRDREQVAKASELLRPDGYLDLSLFEETAVNALEESTLLAYRSYWPDLRSPHVFLGILNRFGSRLSRLLTEQRIADPTSMATTFLAGLSGQHPVDADVRRPRLNREFLSENALLILRRAWQRAKDAGRDRISERDLLTVIMDDPSNIITKSLQQAGIDPQQLLWSDGEEVDPTAPENA